MTPKNGVRNTDQMIAELRAAAENDRRAAEFHSFKKKLEQRDLQRVMRLEEQADQLERELAGVENYPVITLCGSVRFRDDFERVNAELTLRGNIVLSVGCFDHDRFHDHGDEKALETKRRLDRLHLAKISMSNAVYVINRGGHIGDSTRREIAFAQGLGLPVIYMQTPEKEAQ